MSADETTQRQIGDYREDHESHLSPVSVGQDCDRDDCDRTMSKRFARQGNDTCAFCQSAGDDE